MQIPLELNSIINNKYKVIKVLGKGGFGIAYLCQDLKLNISVVLKECFPDPQSSEVKLTRQGPEIFARSQSDLGLFDIYKKAAVKEAKRISTIRHSNIVQIKDSVLTNGTVYIAMDFIEGKGLDEIIAEGQVNASFVLNTLTSLLGALKALHSKDIFHKDLKPENIIIREDNSPVIIDFGAARSASELKLNKTMIYSASYSAPELTDENMRVDGRCDIFSLGVIMHKVITGKIPPPNIKNNGGLKGSVYEKTYNKDFLASIDKARSYIDIDRFSSATAWLYCLDKIKEEERIEESNSGYEANTKDKIVLKREIQEQSQEAFELDLKFSLNQDNSTKLFIGVILFLILCIVIFALDLQLSAKLMSIFLIIALGILPLYKILTTKPKEVLNLYFAQANDEFDFQLHLNADPILFGRSENACIQLSNADEYMCVSREHFTVAYREGEIIINNLKGKDNPMFINGHFVVGELSISTGVGSIFKIGNLTFRLKERE